MNIQPEHIDHIHIRATEKDFAVAGRGRCAAMAEDVDVRKGNMYSHGAKLATVGIVIEGISDLVPTVAAALADPVNQGYLDFWFAHGTTPKGKSCNMVFFGVQ